MASVTAFPFNFQPVSTTIETAGYTPASGKYAYVVPKHWNCAIDGDEVCIVKKETINFGSINATGTMFMLPVRYQQNHENIKIVVTRASGNRTLTYGIIYGKLSNNTVASGNDYFLSAGGNTIISIFENSLRSAWGTSVTSIDVDLNTFYNVTPTADTLTAGLIPNSSGTIPIDVLDITNDGYFYIDTTGGSTATTYSLTVSSYKVFNEGFWIEAGQVLTGDRWIVTEYNKIS
jgi:hypothetical protein